MEGIPQHKASAPLLELFGIKPCFMPMDDCIPVDLEKLNRFANGQLSRDAEEDVFASIRIYKNWYDAWAKLVLEECNEPPADENL